MTALPSIVAGLFILVTVIIFLGIPRSGLAAALAISVMMLPIIARASEVVLQRRPERTPRGQPGLGRPAMADRVASRAPDRPARV